MTTFGAVLAAGSSSRLGRPKQLLELAGEPLVRRAARLLREAGCERVVVVLGANAAAIEPVLAGASVEILHNAAWSGGMGTSLAAAARWALAGAATALLVSVCDQPRLETAHLRALMAAAGEGEAGVVASRYAGVAGVPAVLDRDALAMLATLHGDAGARELLRAPTTRTIDWPAGAFDLDTPADLEQLGADGVDRSRPPPG